MERITEYATDDHAGRPAIYDEATINAIANKEKVDIVCVPVAHYGTFVTYVAYRISAPRTRADITSRVPAYSHELVKKAIRQTRYGIRLDNGAKPLLGYEAFIKAFAINERNRISLSKHFRVLI